MRVTPVLVGAAVGPANGAESGRVNDVLDSFVSGEAVTVTTAQTGAGHAVVSRFFADAKAARESMVGVPSAQARVLRLADKWWSVASLREHALPKPRPWKKTQAYFRHLDRQRLETDAWILSYAEVSQDPLFVEAADLIRAQAGYYHCKPPYDAAVEALRINRAYRSVPVIRNGEIAFERIVMHNLRYVNQLAKAGRRSLPYKDAFQAGIGGLIAAVRRFDVNRGYRFTTMAKWWINDAIYQAADEHEDYMCTRDDNKSRALVMDVFKAQRYLFEKLHREPSIAEIATFLEQDEKQIEGLMLANTILLTLDRPIGKEASKDGIAKFRVDFIPDSDAVSAERSYLNGRLHAKVQQVLQYLDPREQRVIWRYFEFDRPDRGEDEDETSLKEIGRELGVSGERVRQIKDEALWKLGVILSEDLGWRLPPNSKPKSSDRSKSK